MLVDDEPGALDSLTPCSSLTSNHTFTTDPCVNPDYTCGTITCMSGGSNSMPNSFYTTGTSFMNYIPDISITSSIYTADSSIVSSTYTPDCNIVSSAYTPDCSLVSSNYNLDCSMVSSNYTPDCSMDSSTYTPDCSMISSTFTPDTSLVSNYDTSYNSVGDTSLTSCDSFVQTINGNISTCSSEGNFDRLKDDIQKSFTNS